MKLVVSKSAQDDYNALSPNLQKRVDKQFSLLLADRRYPSLRAEKYEGMQAVWQERIDRDYRFYFHIEVDDVGRVRAQARKPAEPTRRSGSH